MRTIRTWVKRRLFWQRFTAPSAHLHLEEQQRQASLLASLSLALLIASILVVIVWIWANPTFTAAPYISVSIIICVTAAYIFSRTRHYQIGAFILIALLHLTVASIILTAPGPMTVRMLALNFLVVSILLASILLSTRLTLLVAVLSLMETAVFFFVPNVPFAVTYSFLVFMVIISALLLLTTVIRNNYTRRLQQTHNLLGQERDMFISGPVVIFKWQNRGNWPVEYVSPNVHEILGYTVEQFMQEETLYTAIIHPEDFKRVNNEVITYSQHDTVRFQHQPYRLIRPDGKIVWIIDHTTILRDETGAITHYMGYLVDITAQMKAEEALHESQERLKLALQGAELGVWDWNITTGIVVYNKRWAEMLGYTLDEIEPNVDAWEKLLHPDEIPAVTAILTEHLEGLTPIYQSEHRLRAKSGEWKWVLDTGKVLVRDEQGNPVRAVGTHQDITERKRLEQQLVRQERLAAVGQLAAGIAHDFNNILASILLYADLLQRQPDITETTRSRLSTISTQGERAARLVSQILDFSQQTIRRPQPVDLAAFVKESAQLLKTTLPENIQVSLDLEDSTLLVEADSSQLQQIITNLAINARFAMPNGGKLGIKVSRAVCKGGIRCAICDQPTAGEWVWLQVTDTGGGIAADILPRIFEPFFTTREIGTGSGLGLSQVSGIVGQHKGHITVESKVGKGTTFTIYLPPLTTRKNFLQSEPPPIKRGKGEKILLVEDEMSVLEATKAVLEHLGYQVLSATTGTEATAIFAEHQQQIALVLSDMIMPDMDGAALFHHLKARNPNLKMIILSGYPLEEKGRKLLTQGMVTWIQKPATFDQLAQAIEKALSNKKGRWD